MSPLGIPLLSTTMVLIILVTILAWIIVGTVVGLENAEEGCCQTNTCGESAAVQVLKVTSIVSGSVLTLIIVFCFHEVVYGRNQQMNPEPKLTQSKSILYTNLFLQLFLWHTKTKKVILTRI